MEKLKIAYFGTPAFSADFLEKLITDEELKKIIEVKLVITQPDKKTGRKQIITPSPVKLTAQKYNLPVSTNFDKSQTVSTNLDLIILYAFGQIIPKDWLTLPKYGFWCVHPSLLPKYRGPSPMTYPLMLDDKTTGVTIYQMDDKIDHGPIIMQEEYKILSTDKRPDLEIKLTYFAFKMFKKLIKTGVEGKGIQAARSRGVLIERAPTGMNPRQAPFLTKEQKHKQATYTRLLTKQDGYIPFETLKKVLNNEPLTASQLPKIIKDYFIKNPNDKKKLIHNSKFLILNLYRAFFPWPGLWTQITLPKCNEAYRRLKITDLTINNKKLTINRVQLEGKKEVDFSTFNRAYKIFCSIAFLIFSISLSITQRL